MPPSPAYRPCRWSSWKPWPRHCSISAWDSIAAEQNGPELTDADLQLIDQRLESVLADGDLGLDADAVLGA